MSLHLDDRHLHQRSLELAAVAVDFDLTQAETGELEDHLAACPTCDRRVAALRSDARVLGQPFQLLPSSRVDAAVYAAIARRPAPPQRLLLLAAATLMLLGALAAGAVGAALLQDRQTLPTTVVPTAPVTVASLEPDPVPDTVPAVLGETWQTLDIPAYTAGGLIEGVAFDGVNLVGVGRGGCVPDFNDPTNCYGAAWTATPDGAWVRTADQPGLEVGLTVPTSGPEKGIFDVAMGPAGLVAIGQAYDETGSGIWRSPDGRTWERIPDALGPRPSNLRLGAIAAGAGGYVVVGRIFDGALTARATAWTSPDGVTWTRAKDSADMDVGPCFDTLEEPSCGGMLGVASTGSGFVAVGQNRTDATAGPTRPAAWTSSDGLTWTRSDVGLDFEGFLSGVTPGGPGLVAIGTICQPDCYGAAAGGIAVTSVDGSSWNVASLPGAIPLDDVAGAGDQVFALGDANGSELQLWRSGDGVAWQRMTGVPSPGAASGYRALDIAATADRIVVVGWAEVGGEGEPFRNFSYVSPATGSAVTPTPTLSPSPTPAPSGPVATEVDPAVLLRVEIRPDVSVGRMPSLTVYRDGTVLRRADPNGRITRLTPAGLELLLAPATDSGLFAASGDIRPGPDWAAGFITYAMDLRQGEAIVHRSTTNVLLTPATKAESERIIALAERLDSLESWLPADAWDVGRASAKPYVASHHLLKVTTFKDQPGSDYPPQPLDVADLEWPLTGSLEGFGELQEPAPLGAGSTSRCGVVTLAEAAAVERALAAAPLVSGGERLQADLGWAAATSHVSVSLVPLLPDDALDCSVDLGWP